jgi:hypothetical protein
MVDLDNPTPEYELHKTPEEASVPERQAPPVKWLLVICVIAAAAAGAYFAFARRSPAPPAATPVAAVPEPVAKPPQPLGGPADPIDVPPLDQSDALVRELVKRLSSNPTVAAFLATDGLIRTFTVSVANIAEGRTPSRHLRLLKPSASFRVVGEGEATQIDPRSFSRYDATAAAVESIDPGGVARLYTILKPRVEEAYRELGAPDTPFDLTLERAIVQLLETPTPPGEIAIARASKGIGYVFADPRMERLTGAQRQLIRMGPGNVRRIKASLRQIALALGIPETRLPTAS